MQYHVKGPSVGQFILPVTLGLALALSGCNYEYFYQQDLHPPTSFGGLASANVTFGPHLPNALGPSILRTVAMVGGMDHRGSRTSGPGASTPYPRWAQRSSGASAGVASGSWARA